MLASLSLTTILAVYGAVLSTIAILRQFIGDRIKVKLTVRTNRQIVGHPKYRGIDLTEVKITNVGRRPVTIVSFGAIGLYPNLSLAGIDSQPQLPVKFVKANSSQAIGLKRNWISPQLTIGLHGILMTTCTSCARHRYSNIGGRCFNSGKHSGRGCPSLF